MYNSMYTKGSVMPCGGHIADVNNATTQAIQLWATFQQVVTKARYGNFKWDHTRRSDFDGTPSDTAESAQLDGQQFGGGTQCMPIMLLVPGGERILQGGVSPDCKADKRRS